MVGFNYNLLFYCDLISCTTPARFSTFYQCAMVPTVVENSKLFVCLFVGFLVMTGEPTHTASKERNGATPHYNLKSEVSITLHCQLYSTHYTTLQIKNYSKSTSAIHAYTLKERIGAARPSYINYCLKSEVFVMLCCQLCVQPVTQQYESRTI